MTASGEFVLGINAGHDGTATVVSPDGRIVAAIGEERLSRVKFHVGFPFRAIDECLRVAGIGWNDIGAVALATRRLIFPGRPEYNALFFNRDLDKVRDHDYQNRPWLKPKREVLLDLVLANVTASRPRQPPADFAREATDMTLGRQQQTLAEIGLGHAPAVSYEHHMCHAAGAAYLSGTDDALVVTLDGAGDGLCATANLFEGGRLRRLSGASDLVSPGRFYAEITGFLGFKRLRHEGKITGLAAFGDSKRFYDDLRGFLRFDPATEQFVYDAKRLSPVRSKLRTVRRILADRLSAIPHVADFYDFLERTCDRNADAKDLAAAAQRILEEVAVEYVDHFLEKHPRRSVLLSGGVFANVRVNQMVAEMPGVEYVYVHQNMGDGGIGTGAALLHVHGALGRSYDGYRPLDVYFGPGYTDAEIEAELEGRGVPYERVADMERRIAALLHAGKIVARFAGRMEYGPRALGNRSILAHTTDRSINDWLNKRLRRTEFMPFAPSVLGPYAAELFDRYDRGVAAYADNFMTITYHVRPAWRERLQAATHVDGTARPQVVWREANPSYYRIIEEYHRLSGIPAVINTSFNMHEEPIVATPADAIRAFQQGALDYLAIGAFLCANGGS
ncbi:MAG: carbamoyl transferase [Candidatus Rokubacteria bacterium]|nr:carbamoyl transferase [Candidatus Rokubacteria bacterium]